MCNARLLCLLVIYLCLGIATINCGNKNEVAVSKNPPIIFIQPLGGCNDSLTIALKTEIEKILPAKVNLMKTIELPANAWYAPRHRYWADSILKVLKPLHSEKSTYTLGITESDISTEKDLKPNWGVMGLGLQPGNCSVVSTYRLYKYPQTQKQLLDKLVKISLHEIGHNAGLPHCANTHCIMTDAKGKDNLDKENNLCEQCRKMLATKGLRPIQSFIF